jgi:hypothetical protein
MFVSLARLAATVSVGTVRSQQSGWRLVLISVLVLDQCFATNHTITVSMLGFANARVLLSLDRAPRPPADQLVPLSPVSALDNSLHLSSAVRLLVSPGTLPIRCFNGWDCLMAVTVRAQPLTFPFDVWHGSSSGVGLLPFQLIPAVKGSWDFFWSSQRCRASFSSWRCCGCRPASAPSFRWTPAS